MKKIIALLIMSVLLVSCGAANEEANESNNEKVTEAVENTDASVAETVETTT
jgi:PBP1b-binding outer membrane lipoprotein LpoB